MYNFFLISTYTILNLSSLVLHCPFFNQVKTVDGLALVISWSLSIVCRKCMNLSSLPIPKESWWSKGAGKKIMVQVKWEYWTNRFVYKWLEFNLVVGWCWGVDLSACVWLLDVEQPFFFLPHTDFNQWKFLIHAGNTHSSNKPCFIQLPEPFSLGIIPSFPSCDVSWFSPCVCASVPMCGYMQNGVCMGKSSWHRGFSMEGCCFLCNVLLINHLSCGLQP